MKFNILVTPELFKSEKVPLYLRIITLGTYWYLIFAQEEGPKFSKVLNITLFLYWIGVVPLFVFTLILYFCVPDSFWSEFYALDNAFLNLFKNAWNPYYQVAEGLSAKNTLFDRYKYYGLTMIVMFSCALFVLINLALLVVSRFRGHEKVRLNVEILGDDSFVRLQQIDFAKSTWISYGKYAWLILQLLFVCFVSLYLFYITLYFLGYLSESDPREMVYMWHQIMLLPGSVMLMICGFYQFLTVSIFLIFSLSRTLSAAPCALNE